MNYEWVEDFEFNEPDYNFRPAKEDIEAKFEALVEYIKQHKINTHKLMKYLNES